MFATRLSIIVCLTGLSASLSMPARATAQTADRITIGVNGAYQTGTSDVASSVAFTANVEPGSFSWKLPVAPGPTTDVSLGVRLWRRLGIGVGYSSFSGGGNADVTARVPHPFFFNQARTISGQASMDHAETAVHIRAVVASAPHRKLHIAAFAGPVFFSVKQSLIESVSYAEAYPYDTATYASAVTKSVSQSQMGFGAGVDVAYYLTRNIGVGVVASIASATVAAKAADDSNVSIALGGTMAGIGLRLRF